MSKEEFPIREDSSDNHDESNNIAEEMDVECSRSAVECKLQKWEAFAMKVTGNDSLFEFFTANFSNNISSKSFSEFKELCKQSCADESKSLPFEICDPNSNWSYVLKYNDIKTWGGFYNVIHARFHEWFKLGGH